jgi:hypothetical protein
MKSRPELGKKRSEAEVVLEVRKKGVGKKKCDTSCDRSCVNVSLGQLYMDIYSDAIHHPR